MTDIVLVNRRDRIVTLTLNRSRKLNALSYALIDRLLALLDEIEVDDAVGAIILTGAGDRAFSAGADIHEFSRSVAAGLPTAMRDFVSRGQRLTARIEAFPKPIIVAVNGLAYGGGCEITEAAPLAIAASSALFAKPEIRLGMPPTFGGTQRLPRLAGRKRALELLLTGDAFTPEYALQLGLINRIVPDDQLLPAARQLALRILQNAPGAIAAILGAVTRGINHSIAEGLLCEGEHFARVAATPRLMTDIQTWIDRRQHESHARSGGLAATRHGLVHGIATSSDAND
jgi:enoyl-CoA hydratase